MPFDNLQDIKRLLGGTCSFTWRENACVGTIHEIEYVPLGPGAVNMTLTDVKPAVGNQLWQVAGSEILSPTFTYTLSCLMAEVTDRPRELIINQLVPDAIYGPIFSFKVKEG